ncbi:uncharacterized protein DNG_06979 [Cephalotrichum gorgonifer]|uniref:Vacuolar protein sorting-associated protein 51 homolog n=1 Tax=Cephalotrichum gorgonifer TaxID=2041049 RepID=A0AAE8N0N7_9PEZI|nr:uncharacterized protein DNG_06979 [Cephalotrichum gorgonifer]
MSTIASPRDRRPPSNLPSPSPSARPSTDSVPPVLSPQAPLSPPPKRKNRAALREYYNLRRAAPQDDAAAAEDARSEVPPSELDAHDFDADAWVERKLDESGLEELLRVYTRVLGEIRALDAEKKALVYDNYSKLISATETIRKMRANMDPLDPVASALDPKIAQIYSQAEKIRDDLRESVPRTDETEERRRTRELAREVLAMPDKLRALVSEGRAEEAAAAWEMPRRLLVIWDERGLGGADVARLIEEGDGILEAGSGSSSRTSES